MSAAAAIDHPATPTLESSTGDPWRCQKTMLQKMGKNPQIGLAFNSRFLF
jgi:hypothetical protein